MRKYKIEYYLKRNAKLREIFDDIIIGNKFLVDRNIEARRISTETGVPLEEVYVYLANWYKLGNDWYNVKIFDDYLEGFINAFLGELISNYFGLLSAHYESAKVILLDGKYSIGVCSKNFCEPNFTYRMKDDYGIPNLGNIYNIENIRDYLDRDLDCQELIQDLKALFVRDYFAGEVERGSDIMFKENNASISLAPLYDYEYSFNDAASYLEYQNKLGILNINDGKTLDFLRSDDYFQLLFSKLLDIKIKDFLEYVKDTIKVIIPDIFEKSILNREEKVKKIVRERVIK